MQANLGKRPQVILAVLPRALTTSCVVYKPLGIVKNLRRTYYFLVLITPSSGFKFQSFAKPNKTSSGITLTFLKPAESI